MTIARATRRVCRQRGTGAGGRRLAGWVAPWLLLLAAAPALAANPADAARIVLHGNGRGAPACADCHGTDGAGNATAGYPRLAGLGAAYLLRQLDSFADHSRKSAVMDPTAHRLDDAERAALATYYSHLPIPPQAARGTTPPADDALGRELAVRGRWSRQVPGCVQCHGPHGVGVGADFPPLAGQPATYLAHQLRAFKDGARANDPMGLMRHVASALDEADIDAVSRWFAAQPARLPESTR